jgi:hypothetical protein
MILNRVEGPFTAKVSSNKKNYKGCRNPVLKAATFGANNAIIGFTPSSEFHHHHVQLC